MTTKIRPVFYVFGSGDSLDYDILVMQAQLGNTQENQLLCVALKIEFEAYLVELGWKRKPININLAVQSGGKLIAVHKGTVDELNNSVWATYSLHSQIHALEIDQKLPRNKHLKIERSLRTILSQFTKTSFRSTIKETLRSSLIDQAKFLETFALDPALFPELSCDIWKSVAFQLGQCLALLQGEAYFCKQDLARVYPSLAPFLGRSYGLNDCLEDVKQAFVLAVLAYLNGLR
jgi:hypothetical protein